MHKIWGIICILLLMAAILLQGCISNPNTTTADTRAQEVYTTVTVTPTSIPSTIIPTSIPTTTTTTMTTITTRPTTFPTTKLTTQPTTASSSLSGVCSCSGNIYNCGDFSSHTAAQACYDYCRSLGKGDIHGLDRDKDGIACE